MILPFGAGSWRVETAAGRSARVLDPPPPERRTVRIVTPEDRAVVLGSTQHESDIDPVRAATAGVAVLRRRSGGGAVMVGPGQVLWVDVAIPAGDALWSADVARAFWWLGAAWAAALAAAGLPGAEAWRGGLIRTAWSDRVCFAGLGPGEVTLDAAKVVGLSQRRTRAGAQFQCAVPIVWEPSELLGVMALDEQIRAEGTTALAHVAVGVGPAVIGNLTSALVEQLRAL